MAESAYWRVVSSLMFAVLLYFSGEQARAQQPSWSLDAGGTVSVNASDNVNLEAVDRDADVVTTTSINLSASRTTRTINAQLSGNLSWDAYAQETQLNGLRYNAIAFASSEFFDRRFSLDLRANTNEQNISGGVGSTAFERTVDNDRTQILNFSAQPVLRTNIRNWAIVEARYSFSGSLFFSTDTSDDPIPITDTLIHNGSVLINSGTYFPRLTVGAQASFEETDRSDGIQSSERRDVQGTVNYQLFPRLIATSRFGYETIIEPSLNQDVEDPFVTAGFEWAVGPRTQINFSGGYRYSGPNFEGSITYVFNERLNLQIRYAESIETQQRLVASNLNNIDFDLGGNPVDINTGVPTDPGSLPFELQNNAFRRDAVNLGLSGRFGRNQYSLGGSFEVRDTNGSKTEQVRLDASLSRVLTPRSSAQLGGSIIETTSDATGDETSWNANISYTHQLSDSANIVVSYGYIKRDSSRITSYHESIVRLSAAKNF